jgi:hypothetical protein
MIGRKGDWTADYLPFMIIFIFVAVILIFAFIFTTQRFVSDSYRVPEGLEDFIIQRRFFSSCFGAQDPLTGRTEHYVIDTSKFNQETMDRCSIFESTDTFFAYELTLRVGENPQLPLKTSNWRENRFAKSSEHNVQVRTDNAVLPGKLTIEVQHADE